MDQYKVFNPLTGQHSELLSAADAAVEYDFVCQQIIANSSVGVSKVFVHDNGDQQWSDTSPPVFEASSLASTAVNAAQYEQVTL